MIETAAQRIERAKKFTTDLNEPVPGPVYARVLENQLEFMEKEYQIKIKRLEREAA